MTVSKVEVLGTQVAAGTSKKHQRNHRQNEQGNLLHATAASIVTGKARSVQKIPIRFETVR
jgi:hypothetical protein